MGFHPSYSGTMTPPGPNKLSIFNDTAKTIVLIESSNGRYRVDGTKDSFRVCDVSTESRNAVPRSPTSTGIRAAGVARFT